MKQYRWLMALVVGAFLLAACGGPTALLPDTVSLSEVEVTAPLVEPTVIDGNPSCVGQGFDFGFKPTVFDSDAGKFIDFDSGTDTFTFTYNGVDFEIWVSIVDGEVAFMSELLVAAVLVKGGPNANHYDYQPYGTFEDSGLVPPTNPRNGKPFGVSHVEFCFDLETILRSNVVVTKTAETELDRTWTWDIEKTSDVTQLTLAVGETHVVDYEVTVSATFEDTKSRIYGTITVTNNSPFAVDVTALVDEVAAGVAADIDVECVLGELEPGGFLECEYTYDYAGGTLTDTSGINIATATIVYGDFEVDNEGTFAWDFADATIGTETDECIDVTDDKYDFLGEVCANQLDEEGEYLFDEYALDIRYDQCGEYEFVNVASFVTNDSGADGSDDHTVLVSVPCVVGCTLTQGYWKTHSEYGPAPYDGAWGLLQEGAATIFFLSGLTWYEVFMEPAGGNVYYILAYQYMAATLNILNGAASTPEVVTAIEAAEEFFETYTPATASTLTTVERDALIVFAETLDDYNNGRTGPGHCSE